MSQSHLRVMGDNDTQSVLLMSSLLPNFTLVTVIAGIHYRPYLDGLKARCKQTIHFFFQSQKDILIFQTITNHCNRVHKVHIVVASHLFCSTELEWQTNKLELT